MKLVLAFFFFTSVAAFPQKVKYNEYDKFIKQRRIELEPEIILNTDSANVFLEYRSLASTFYIILSGYGWGESMIDLNQEVIFLFSNDSTVTVQSTGIQGHTLGALSNTYHHKYFINVTDIEALSKYELIGIRKYDIEDYSDMKVSKPYAEKIRRLSSVFLEELKKAKLIYTLKYINVTDVAKYIGDSVRFCSKVFSARYFESSENKPTLLDVNASFPNQLLNIVIWDRDRKNFAGAPEVMYNNKEVCISGVVQLVSSLPRIVIRHRDQVTVKTPVRIDEVAFFVGDSVTVNGTVFTGRYVEDSANAPTLLTMGAPGAEQVFTVVIKKSDRFNFDNAPERYYTNKEINVAGRITLSNGKPQIVVHTKDQITIVKTNATSPVLANTKFSEVKQGTNTSETNNLVTEVPARFPGGKQGLIDYLSKNLVSPIVLDTGKRARVVVQFLINTDGKVSNFKIIESGGKLFDKEVIRVLQAMPRWTPKLQNGRPVAEVFTQPVTFNFTEEDAQSLPIKSF